MNSMSAARQWTVATIVIAVLLLVAAWFLLVSPVMATASETNANAEAQEDMNDNTQIEVDKLRKQFAEIETYQEQLTGLQQGITTRQQYSDLQRMFSETADAHNVVITSLTFGSAEPLEVVTAGEEEAEDSNVATTEPVASPSPEPNADGTTDPAPAAPKGVQGLYSIAVGITITGEYNNVLAAMDELQTGDQRIVLITSVALAADADSGAADAEQGDKADPTNAVVATMSGSTFVLVSSDAQKDNGDSELPEEEIPLPESTDNPLTPPSR